ncbi:MAG: hypothetical protein AB1469_01120 [Pseudomonadota bacterium]
MQAHDVTYLICLLGFLCGPARADVFKPDSVITDPAPARFSVCSEHTCSKVSVIGLEPAQWDGIRAVFMPAARNAAQERAYIARAVTLMETLVGPLTGTAHDKGRIYQGVGLQGQMDCIDESTNTSLYLIMMVRDGLIKWHNVEDRATRGFFIFGWPHTTAVISDKQSGELFAVDSWFLDNGQPPYILPLQTWKDGWNPEP